MNEDRKSASGARRRHASEVDGSKMKSERHEGVGRPRVDDQVVDAIGRQLKASYDKLLAEPVPDRFFELLDQLGRQDASADDGGSDREKK